MNRDEMYLSLGVSDKANMAKAMMQSQSAQSAQPGRNAEKPRECDALRRLDRLRLR